MSDLAHVNLAITKFSLKFRFSGNLVPCASVLGDVTIYEDVFIKIQ